MRKPYKVIFMYCDEDLIQEENMPIIPSKYEQVTIDGVRYEVIEREFSYTNGWYKCYIRLRKAGYAD